MTKKRRPLLRLLARRRKKNGNEKSQRKKRRRRPLEILKLAQYPRRTRYTTASKESLALHPRNSRARFLAANLPLQAQRSPKDPHLVPLLQTSHVQPVLLHRELVMPSLLVGLQARSTLRRSRPSLSSAARPVQRLPSPPRRSARPIADLKLSPHRRRRNRLPPL